MDFFSFFIGTALAAEQIISPLPDEISKPTRSFAVLASSSSSPRVLGIQTTDATQSSAMEHITTPMPLPTVQPSPETKHQPVPSPSPSQTIQTKKNVYTVALIGDSMIDTLGPDAQDCVHALNNIYPNTSFIIQNFGVGGTNIDAGLERITNGYDYLGVPYPSLASILPDIVVIESFAYNPYPTEEGELNRHWLALAAIVDSVRRNIPGVRILLAATIAPNSSIFADGAPGLSMSREEKRTHTARIKQYLESTTAFAKSEHLPLADAFHPSINRFGEGNTAYINSSDHIHYSPSGKAFMCNAVANAIATNRLVE